MTEETSSADVIDSSGTQSETTSSPSSGTDSEGNPVTPGEVPEKVVKRFSNVLSEKDIKKYQNLPRTKPAVMDFKPSNGEQVIAIVNVVQFGAKGDAQTDDYEAFAAALNIAHTLGGGTVYVPAGTYYISKPLQIPPSVTLRGAYDSPEKNKPGTGTLIITDYAETGLEGTPFIRVYNGSAVKNLSFYYINQSFSNPKDYAPTIGIAEKYRGAFPDPGAGFVTIENIMFYNSSIAYCGALMVNGGMTMRNIWGTPLKYGMIVDQSGEFSFMATVDFDPKYYAECGLYGAPKTEAEKKQLRDYVRNVAVGYYVGRHDMMSITNVKATGYYKGIEIGKPIGTTGTWRQHDGGALIADVKMIDCFYGVYVNEVIITGRSLDNSTITCPAIKGSVGVYFSNRFSAKTSFTIYNVTINGSPTNAVLNAGAGQVYIENCDFDNWTGNEAIESKSGDLYVIGCRFNKAAAEINAVGSNSVAVLGNTFKSSQPTVNTSGISSKNVQIDHTSMGIEKLPKTSYVAAKTIPKAAKDTIFYAEDYGVDSTGQSDSASGLQKALDAAGRNGGGVVYVKGGKYLLKKPLTVPKGVELRGCTESRVMYNQSFGTLFLIPKSMSGTNTPTVSLMAGSGIRGIYFAYPDQIEEVNSAGNWVFDEYPVAVQSQGDGCWAIHVSAVNAYRFLDFGTKPNKNFYILGAYGFAIKDTIYVGNNSGTGVLEECIMTIAPWLYDYHGINRLKIKGDTEFNESGEGDNEWTRLMNTITGESDCYKFGYNENIIVAFCCTYGGRAGFAFCEQDGKYTKNAFMYFACTDAVNTSFDFQKAGKVDVVVTNGCALLSKKEKCYIRMSADCGADVDIQVPLFAASGDTAFRIAGGSLAMHGLRIITSGDPMAVVTGGDMTITNGHLFISNVKKHVQISNGSVALLGCIVADRSKSLSEDPIGINRTGGTVVAKGNTVVNKFYPYA